MKRMILLIIGWCLIGQLSLSAQDVEEVLTMTEQLNKYEESVSLEESLKFLENKYDVTLIYESRLVKDKVVPKRVVEAENFQMALTEITVLLNLEYQQVGNRSFFLSAQEDFHQKAIIQETITGTVADAQSGETLPGVNVMVKGTTTGTSTDGEGSFELTVESLQDTLVFSFVGFQTQEVPINGRTEIDVVLQSQAIAGEELVVVGYGTQQKSNVTGAISSISSEDLSGTPSSNILEQSQGKLAGVDIVRSNGEPGANTQIRIRGNRSINASNAPLYVIDGIPTSASIDDINPNDIESIEVLKDASSVAIYGSRGANGVVMITTKKGIEGKPVISYNGYYGFKEPIEDLNLMNGKEFAEYVRVSRGLDPSNDNNDSDFLSNIEVSNLQEGVYQDWLDPILQSGAQQNHQISVGGGSSDITYYLSGSFYDEEGIVNKSDFKRYSFRANIQAELNDKLSIGLSSTISNSFRNQMSNAPFSGALRYSPLITPYDSQGNFLPYPNPREGLLTNPLMDLQPNQHVDETKRYRIFANIFGEYKLTDNLTFRINYGPDYVSSRQGNFSGSLDGSSTAGSINNENDFTYTLENILTYDNEFGDHSLNLVGLFSIQENNFESNSARGEDIPIEKSTFTDLGSAATLTGIESNLTEWTLLSYMGRVNYQFQDKYLLTISGRADGSSRLAAGNKWNFFPAVAMGWLISEEDFFNISSLTSLKLRASYGEVGNTSIVPYGTLGGLDQTTYAFGNSGAFGFGLSEIANPDLSWEVSKTINLGLDYSLFNGRLSGALEFYNTRTDDLLLERQIPTTSGYSFILQNIGSTKNRGIEFTASANLLNTRSDFSWGIDFNIYSNKEEIVELSSGKEDDIGNEWFIGQPIDVFYSYKQTGIWQEDEMEEAAEFGQEPGDIKIEDVNGRNENDELTGEPDGEITTDDRTVLGSTVPDWSGGITNRFGYKGLNLSIHVYARQGQLISSGYHDVGANNWQGRYNSISLNYWAPQNSSNKYPRPDAGSAPLYADAVRYFNGSFVKIKNIRIGYTIQNQTLLGYLGMSSVELYSTINNAITFSTYQTADPETSNGIIGPNSRLTTANYMVGINIDF